MVYLGAQLHSQSLEKLRIFAHLLHASYNWGLVRIGVGNLESELERAALIHPCRITLSKDPWLEKRSAHLHLD